MEQIFNLLGFTDTISIAWNILAYGAMILITIAVVSAKWRNLFFVLGPFILLFYAWLYLQNPLLIGLQFVITTSGMLNFFNIKKLAPFVVIGLAVMVFAALLITGQISSLWLWFGAFGLLGLAFGLTQLPKKTGFIVMMVGGLLIVVYSFALQVWVFFALNIIFFVANIFELRKK